MNKKNNTTSKVKTSKVKASRVKEPKVKASKNVPETKNTKPVKHENHIQLQKSLITITNKDINISDVSSNNGINIDISDPISDGTINIIFSFNI